MPTQGDSPAGGGGWSPVRRQVRAYELVLEQIETQIRQGGLQRGDRLPGERQLSELLGVSRPSVREALRSLEALGIVSARVSAGPESAAVLATAPSDALSSMLRMHIGLSNFTEMEVVQTRSMVEERAAREAADNITAEEAQGLRRILEAMDRPGIDIMAFNALDSSFHTGIANAGKNRLVAYLVGALRDAVERHRLTAMRSLGDWADVSRDLQMQHHRLLDCIERGDSDAAAHAIRDHLQRTYPAVDMGGSPDTSE